MRLLIGSSLCVCAMFVTGFSMAQEDESRDGTAESFPARTARPVPPAPPARFEQVRTSPGSERGLVQDEGRLVQYDPFGGTFWYPGDTKEEAQEALRKTHELQSFITKASRLLRSDDADTKEKAQEDLRKAIGELFDLRSKVRKKQIKDLEERLAKLRKQMEQREDKKADIIRLHIQTIVNQANGLGF